MKFEIMFNVLAFSTPLLFKFHFFFQSMKDKGIITFRAARDSTKEVYFKKPNKTKAKPKNQEPLLTVLILVP